MLVKLKICIRQEYSVKTKNDWSSTSAPPIYLHAVDRYDFTLLYMTQNYQKNLCFPDNTQIGKFRPLICHEGPEGE